MVKTVDPIDCFLEISWLNIPPIGINRLRKKCFTVTLWTFEWFPELLYNLALGTLSEIKQTKDSVCTGMYAIM